MALLLALQDTLTSFLPSLSGCGKTTAFKSLLDNRPLSLYFAMREVCDRALRIECFMRDFLSALGLSQVWGSKWLRALPRFVPSQPFVSPLATIYLALLS
jgi:hypothetical protein